MRRRSGTLSTRGRARPLVQGLAVLLLQAVLATAGSTASAQGPAAASKEPTQWWNDPVLAAELDLSAGQRSKMDEAYARYEKALEPVRENRDVQRRFYEALESGQFDRARSVLGEWTDVSARPHHAMAELKLQVLEQLEAGQLEKLVATYPRLVKRQWRPSVSWSRKQGDDPRQSKGFQAGRPEDQPGPKPGKPKTP